MSRDVILRIANAPFAQQDMTLVAAYLDALATRFGAGIRLVDYKTQTEAARHAINGWVGDQTEGRIPELIQPGLLVSLTRLVLVNAIYLKAPWLTPFDVADTVTGPFTREDGSPTDVPMMRSHDELAYAEGQGWRAVELPYLGGSLAMTLILPDDIAAFEAGLDAAAYDAIIAALGTRNVDLSMPRFDTETKVELSDLLVALGMPLAFDPFLADFSGITTEEQLYISEVIHQANITVDEKGTEAAAATAVVMRAGSAPGDTVTFAADHPFLFVLRDVPTGAIVFMGRVVDPS